MDRINKREIKAVWHARDLGGFDQIYKLTLLSIHDHVVNLSYGSRDHLLIIGDSVPAKGPAAVGLSDSDFLSLKKNLSTVSKGSFSKRFLTFKSSREFLLINWREGQPISFSPERFNNINQTSAAHAAAGYLIMLKGGGIPGDAAVLTGEVGVDNLFRKTIKESFPSLAESLARYNENEFLKYCRKLAGMGRGLTPDGDDLIHGALVAFHYFNYNREFIKRIEKNFSEIALTTNIMGRHMLLTALEGLTPQPVKNLLLSIGRGRPEPGLLKEVKKIGFSTGYDIVLAALLFIKNYLAKENKISG